MPSRSTRSSPAGSEPIDGASGFADLPDSARRYTEFVERELDVPVELIGTGAERERVLTR